ncbi:NAD(P)H-binding protein [Pantoea sp. Cy-640]|uniref:NAD(P)H-binding protein n=1 Tax=Pantoea sp. Cy-640 TaxID=2608353 RepID=UPI001419F0E1|nr:NAD(P)H-binding protein [Pantoea sp. Cy-640]NIG16177.1 NAD(P)H-binding protein [Pantoea sp. Cy-640]
MKKILILGAAGSLARVTADYLSKNHDIELTLFLRNSYRLKSKSSENVKILEGDIRDFDALCSAMINKDIIYANLSGDLKEYAEIILKAMKITKAKKLIFISSMGIYDEVPGNDYGDILKPYREAAGTIENSDVSYVIIRPAWFINGDDINYQVTHKGEPFIGEQVTRLSIAHLIEKIVLNPDDYIRVSLGVSQCN